MPSPYPGIYRAKALRLDTGNRLAAVIPQLFGEETVTITAFVGSPPTTSEMGWVAFHGGLPQNPVWLGVGTGGGGGGGGTGTVTDVVWVGTSAPVDPSMELWWDTDEPAPPPDTGLIPTPTVRLYTANATWTKPAGLVYAEVEVQAGGGAGGGAPASTTSNTSWGMSGGAGGYTRKTFLASELPATQAVVVGAGGTGVSGAVGNSGGNSQFGDLSAIGGSYGSIITASVTTTLSTALSTGYGSGSGGDINEAGGRPGPLHRTGVGSIGSDNGGGASHFGAGAPWAIEANGWPAENYGSGGGGMRNSGAVPARVGGAGGTGCVIITEWVQEAAVSGITEAAADARYLPVDTLRAAGGTANVTTDASGVALVTHGMGRTPTGWVGMVHATATYICASPSGIGATSTTIPFQPFRRDTGAVLVSAAITIRWMAF